MNKKLILVPVILLAVLGLSGCADATPYHDGKSVTCKVTDKDRSTETDKDGNSSSVYRIYTTGTDKDCGVFEISDNVLQSNWNSADIYGQIQRDHTYKISATGWRNGLFSMFPNIYKVVEVKNG